MRRGIVKSSNIIVLNRIAVLLIACVLSFIAGISFMNAGRPITLLNSTTVSEIKNDTQPLSVESVVNTGPAQPVVLPAPEVTPEKQNIESESEQAVKWRVVRMKVTGYCPCSKCCGEYSDGITASGHKIQPGDTFVAADKRYSFDTEMVIEGYNNSQVVKVLDRGGAIRGNKLDAFFHTHQEALEWGVRYIDVKVRDM